MLSGGSASFKGVKVTRPFDPEKQQLGAFELAARLGGLRVADSAFSDGLADPSKSARAALAVTGGLRWHANRSVRLYLDFERTTFDGGASSGNRPAENVILTRLQASF